MEISPALWQAIKNTERGLTGPGPGGLLRLKAELAQESEPGDLDGFLAERGGERREMRGAHAVLLDIPAMYALELWQHSAVSGLEPADQAKTTSNASKAPKLLAAAALAALLILAAWLGLEQYQKTTSPKTSPNIGQKQQPIRPATPKVEPARPLPGEGPVAVASRSRKTNADAAAAPAAPPAAKPAPQKETVLAAARPPAASPSPVKAEKGQPDAKAKAASARPAAGKEKAALAEAAAREAMEAMWEGDAQKAVSLLKKALEKDPGHLGLRTNLGLALMELGRLDEAEVQFKAVLERKPGDQEALSALQLIKQARKN